MMALILGVTSVTTLYDVSWVGLILLLSLTTLLFMLKGIDFFDSFMSGYGLSVSELNYGLLLLSAWVIMLSVLASGGVERGKNYARVFSKANATLLLALIFTFSAQDYILFYISFEVTLLPTLLLVLGWGYQPERIQAGMYMLFYTLLGSLPLLVCLLLVGLEVGSFSYMFSGVSLDLSELWLLFSVSAFLFKLPMYFVHLWLPKAHVEAPVAGSMILAGVLLKLGGYGLMIVASMFMTTWVNLSWFIIMAGGVGGALVGILCLRQVDMKSLVAYSSVAHMGLTLCGFVIFNWWGVSGAYGVMLGHGLCSSGMFFLVNILYERTGSRSLMISKGAISFMPSMCLWWFLMCTSNMAAPPSLNLLGEVSLIISSLSWDPSLGPLVFSLSFLSGAYSLYLFSVSQHGKSNQSVYAGGSGKVSEFMVAALHWAPLNILFLNGDMFMFSV